MTTSTPIESPETLVVHILGKDYQVSCLSHERQDLVRAAAELDNRMRNIRNTGNVLGGERIAVITALNLANEVLQAERSHQDQQLLDRLHHRLDTALEADY